MWTETNNYRKIDRACSELIQLKKLSFHSGIFDTPSGKSLTLIRVVISALICPRVDFFMASDGRYDFSDDDRLNLVFSRDDGYANKSWDRIQVLEQYVDKNRCQIWTNGEHTYVSLDSMDYRKWFKLVSGITLLCPWVFANKPLSDIEKEFLKIIAESDERFDEERFDEICGILYENIGLEKIVIEKVAYDLTKKSYDRRVQHVKSEIENCRNQIQYYEKQISSYLNSLQNNTTILNGLYGTEGKGMDELQDFLKSADIHDFEFCDNKIIFTVYSLLSCYEEGQVKPYVLDNNRVLRGEYGWNKTYVDAPYTAQEMKEFYKAVFVDKTLWIKLAAKYSISIDVNVEAISYSGKITSDRINNPNIGYAGCLGGYSDDLRQAREANDPIAALSICQQSACSVNLGEIWPMASVTQDLFSSKGKVIHTDDGDITFAEAMERIKAQMNKE